MKHIFQVVFFVNETITDLHKNKLMNKKKLHSPNMILSVICSATVNKIAIFVRKTFVNIVSNECAQINKICLITSQFGFNRW